MATVYLALGSNLGERRLSILRAVDELKFNGVRVLRLSSIVETDPVDAPPPKYFNAVLKASTSLSPEQLLELIQNIERKFGRVRTSFHAPRLIDIDILLYDDIKFISRYLIIPHPRMFERAFVMGPLKEIEPKILN